jgi:Ca2+-binding RTX toxin-like protein
MAHYTGTNQADIYSGTAASDHIEGFAGDDWLKDGPAFASSVADQIFGGTGNDVISVAGGADTIGGGLGQDRLVLRYELSSTGLFLNIDENTGNSIASSNGLSITGIETFEFRLGSGNDTVYAGSGDDDFYGNGGNDVFLGRAGSDVAFGGMGEDDLYGGADQDDLDGGADDDVLYGGNGNDGLSGGTGHDVLHGGSGDDHMSGGAGADQLRGNGGVDSVSYSGSTAVVVSLLTGIGSGGEAQGDTLSGIENLSGSQGHDSLVGNSGANTLQGWNGNEALTGADGKDMLTGGAGADRFVYDSTAQSVVGANADVITDFSHAQADRIDLAAVDANTGGAGDQTFSFIGSGAYTGVAGQLHYSIAGGVTTVAGDINGDSISDFHIQLAGSIALVAGDFLL